MEAMGNVLRRYEILSHLEQEERYLNNIIIVTNKQTNYTWCTVANGGVAYNKRKNNTGKVEKLQGNFEG